MKLYLLRALLLFIPLTLSQGAFAQTCSAAFVLDYASSISHSLVPSSDRMVQLKRTPSPGISDPLIEEARVLNVHPDFKFLSDLRPKDLSTDQRAAAFTRASSAAHAAPHGQSRKAYVASLIRDLYESGSELLPAPARLTRPRVSLNGASHSRRATFETIEKTWETLTRLTPESSRGSLIPLPHPVIIPGSRFQESYYWDSYFGNKALIRTGRWDLAAMQVENFLFMVKQYGLVPNGMRDYYLSRSQPPLLTSMARDVIEAGLRNGKAEEIRQWLRSEAFELMVSDYQNFWMNPQTRLDQETGLNHHWDAHNREREERHSADRDDLLGRTYRDVRAEAESGKDFTDGYGGEATRVAPVLLNSVLYKTEKDLAWMARLLGEQDRARNFEAAAERRQQSMNRYLWDSKANSYREYHLDRKVKLPMSTADVFVPLWAGVATREQAEGVRTELSKLESNGGILASDRETGKQWDAPYGWAPQQYFAMDGLQRYGFQSDATRIANKWTGVVERIHDQTGKLIEKVDVVRADRPIEHGDKYETQEGFLWTNAVYVLALTDILGVRLNPRMQAVSH